MWGCGTVRDADSHDKSDVIRELGILVSRLGRVNLPITAPRPMFGLHRGVQQGHQHPLLLDFGPFSTNPYLWQESGTKTGPLRGSVYDPDLGPK
jgi:hypothetical protein